MPRSRRPVPRTPRARARTPLRATAGAGVLAVLLAACGGGTPTAAGDATYAADPLDTASVEELYEQARQEGRVVVYSFTSRIAEVEAAFEAAYPGVDLVGNDISATQQIARIRAEAAAGTPGADVAYLSDAPVVLSELVSEGLLRNYVPPRIAGSVPAEYTEPLLANRLSTKTLMYNEEAHPEGPP
ncbi:MAG TPA: hypothetical protein VD813_06855, partial [Pseudonocardia sp.]|nr:hypothetical protein [Pseudonocardia sp.]